MAKSKKVREFRISLDILERVSDGLKDGGYKVERNKSGDFYGPDGEGNIFVRW